ncbi:Dynein assembly factor 3 [Blattella germanica]|nr:Dynein assembly factor 3 [Blattella germanica]
MWWGISPALDVVDLLKKHGHKGIWESSEDLHVLLVGTADARHILKTVAQWYRHGLSQSIHFHVHEKNTDLVARQMLLLTIALEPPDQLGLHEKMLIFLELYGNTLVRPTTAHYLGRKSAQLVHMITDLEFQASKPKTVFKFWQQAPARFPIAFLWDKRLRKHLGTRYDNRAGVFDWDYHMVLKPRGAELVTSQEYKLWRNSGVAFTWLETQEMLQKRNGMHLRRSVDIAERNVSRLFHEVLHREPYSPPKESNNTYGGGVVITEVPEAGTMMTESVPSADKRKEIYSALPLEFADITFLPQSGVKSGSYHAVLVSHRMREAIPELAKFVSDGGLLVAETDLFNVEEKNQAISESNKKLQESLKDYNFSTVQKLDQNKESYVVSIKQ